MKIHEVSLYGGVVAALLLCGCASEPTGNDRPLPLKYYTRAELEDMKTVQLPSNYSVDNFTKLQLGVAFSVSAKDGTVKVDPALSSRLQTEMAKLKRFTIFSMHNRK